MKQAVCPICHAPFKFKDELSFGPYPFCSDKCRLIDLGAWLTESYSVDEPMRPMSPEEFAELAQAANEAECERDERVEHETADTDDDE